jgi:hypothetical protein
MAKLTGIFGRAHLDHHATRRGVDPVEPGSAAVMASCKLAMSSILRPEARHAHVVGSTAVLPPSAVTIWPVTKDAALEARKKIARAISLG